MHKQMVGNRPWIILGDFNVGLNIEDHSVGSTGINIGMREFRECVESLGIVDLNSSGLHYTWNQRQNANTGILKNLDKAMVNNSFLSIFPNSCACFQPHRISDRTPVMVTIPTSLVSKL